MKTSPWYSARVRHLRDVTPTVREFTLDTPQALAWQPGAHIQVQVLVGDALQQRHYSLLPSSEPQTLCIAVKRMDAGQGGSRAMWQLRTGDSIRISAPRQHFTLEHGAPEYLLLAGGIGITPLLSMAKALAARGAKVQMLYGVRSEDELAYLEPLRDGLGKSLHISIGQPPDLQAQLHRLHPQAQAYVCGPMGLLTAARKAWQQAGRPQAALRFESFGGSASTQAPQSFTVRMPRHQMEFEVAPQHSLLQAIEQAGVQAMQGCLRGECGLCVLDVLDLQGEIEHRDIFLSDQQKASNAQICICVSRVKGCVTLDSAYRPDQRPSITASEPLHN